MAGFFLHSFHLKIFRQSPWLRFTISFAAVHLFSGNVIGETGPAREKAVETMKRATVFMVEKVSYEGGYVWSYLADFSRRWGELEARPTMIWIQPPGTPSMGHLFLDAYHATGDEYYYQAAEKVADALIRAQHPAGGWNYVADFAGEDSLREWYATVGRNAWRLEEFQHYYGNATFDDSGTAQSAEFLLRLFLEKNDAKYRVPLDSALQFILKSQYPIGAWPQRYPPAGEFSHSGHPDYTGYLTFNDDVAAENIDFLIMCYQALGEERLLDPIHRAMNSYLVTQQPAPQAGWALQYTPDLKPAGARTYEPQGLCTHGTAHNIEQLLKFYRLTGDSKFLARIPEALDWLQSCQLPPDQRTERGAYPTFVELETNLPLYLHRTGSNVFNGHYFVDHDPKKVIGHYSSIRDINVPALRTQFEKIKALSSEEATRGSPLLPGISREKLPRFFSHQMDWIALSDGQAMPADRISRIIDGLNADGCWLSPLRTTSHPYHGDGTITPSTEDFSHENVGDESDTSPYRNKERVMGISILTYIRNMSALIGFLESNAAAASSEK